MPFLLAMEVLRLPALDAHRTGGGQRPPLSSVRNASKASRAWELYGKIATQLQLR
jgi:hypothetical protein